MWLNMETVKILEKLRDEATLKKEALGDELMKGNGIDPNKIREYQKFDNIKNALFDLIEMIKAGQIGK